MSARPGAWHLVGYDGDPVAGDPQQVDVEAAHYTGVAAQIRAQVTRLRQIAAEETLLGQYAETLKTAADELAGRLEETVGRYERVGSALRTWRPHLDTARTDTARALQDAVEAQARAAANEPQERITAPDAPPDPEQELADRQRAARHQDATGDLAAARRRCEDAVDERDRQAEATARTIEDAIDDGVEDSWWDDVKDFVDRHAELIKGITEVLSWIATGLAIVALFIPGLNVIALLAIGFTLATLAGHSLLAATGNGSWLDVALDVFALLTLGTGKIAASAVRAASAGTQRAAATAARGQAVAARSGAQAQRRAIARTLSGRRIAPARRARLQREYARISGTMGPKPSRVYREVMAEAPGPTTLGQRVLHGGDEAVTASVQQIRGWASRFPGDAAVRAAAAGATPPLTAARIAFGTGAAVDLGDKILGDSTVVAGKPAVDAYGRLKDRFTAPIGSTW